LDSNWKLATSTLPWVALTDTFTVSTSADLTTLSSADQWDIAIVTSENKTYVLSVAPYSTASNWKQILSPTWWVTSVNGQTWAVTVQETLVNQTNIKSVNGNSLLWSGNLVLHSSISITLTTAWWSSNTQTVSATGVTASNIVIVSPNPSDYSDYTDAEIYCSAQGSGTLTFTCGTTPSSNIDVNVLILS
jgi:hypothetical protein